MKLKTERWSQQAVLALMNIIETPELNIGREYILMVILMSIFYAKDSGWEINLVKVVAAQVCTSHYTKKFDNSVYLIEDFMNVLR